MNLCACGRRFQIKDSAYSLHTFLDASESEVSGVRTVDVLGVKANPVIRDGQRDFGSFAIKRDPDVGGAAMMQRV